MPFRIFITRFQMKLASKNEMRAGMIAFCLPEKKRWRKQNIVVNSYIYTILLHLTVFDSSTVCDQDSMAPVIRVALPAILVIVDGIYWNYNTICLCITGLHRTDFLKNWLEGMRGANGRRKRSKIFLEIKFQKKGPLFYSILLNFTVFYTSCVIFKKMLSITHFII